MCYLILYKSGRWIVHYFTSNKFRFKICTNGWVYIRFCAFVWVIIFIRMVDAAGWITNILLFGWFYVQSGECEINLFWVTIWWINHHFPLWCLKQTTSCTIPQMPFYASYVIIVWNNYLKRWCIKSLNAVGWHSGVTNDPTCPHCIDKHGSDPGPN